MERSDITYKSELILDIKDVKDLIHKRRLLEWQNSCYLAMRRGERF